MLGRVRVILALTLVLMMGAGVVVGRLWARLPERGTPAPGRPPSWLAGQLGLSAEQSQSMDAIWADTRAKLNKANDGRRALDREREAAVVALLSPEQQAAYRKLQDDFRARRAELDHEHDRLIDDANARSEALLTDAQKRKWAALGRDRGGDRDHRRPHGGPPATQRSNATTAP